jgi:hypothetical protein
MTVQGQSVSTIDKVRRIGSALSVNMLIASRPRFEGKGYSYWHFDANAGSGFNAAVGVPGSPVVFWDAADKCLRGLHPRPFFCDINDGYMATLQRTLGTRARSSVLLPGDNEEALLLFGFHILRSGEKASKAMGSVLCDPNAYWYRNKDNEGVPIRALQWFLPKFESIDLVLNVNTRTYRMQAPHGHNVLPPRMLLASLHKKHWVVGHTSHGGDTFLIAIGRNYPAGDHRALGLYNSTSEMGNHILDVAEGRRQSKLEFAIPNVSRIPRSSSVSHGSRDSDAKGQRALRMRQSGDRSPSSEIPAVGHVRCAQQPEADLS